MDEKLTRLFAGRAVAWDRLLLTDGLPPEAVDRLTALTPAAPERVWVVLDHDAPAGTVAVAEKQKKLQDFARRTGARFFSGRGIGYALLLEDGLREGEIVLSGGSHAAGVGAAGAAGLCLDSASLAESLVSGQVSLPAQAPLRAALTGALSPYLSVRDLALSLIAGGRCAGRAVVLSGGALTAAERMDLCGLLGAAGAVTALFTEGDGPADMTVDLSALPSLAVLPGDLRSIVPAARTDGLRVNQVFIGGCGGGSLEALRQAADIWRGRKLCPGVRVMVAPATSAVYVQALDEGLMDVFLDAGALILNQGCSACWAQSQGRCDRAEVFATTGSINCAGWAGRDHNGICLTSVRKAAWAAVSGSLYES